MTHVTTIVSDRTILGLHIMVASVNISSYTASGEVMTLSEFGFSYIEGLFAEAGGVTYMVNVDEATLKLRCFTASGTEVAGAVNVGSNTPIFVVVIGV